MNSQEPFKRDYGFIFIVTPEDKAKYGPKLETDEYWANLNQSWYRVGFGSDFSTTNHYRRRISPGPNHEIVPLDGVVLDGDEFYNANTSSWFRANIIGKTVRDTIAASIGIIPAYRRPISKPVESGWVSVKERLPEPYQQVVAIPPSTHDAKDGLLVSLESYNTTNYRWVKVITHWMPIPPAPQPLRPAAEVAWEKWWHSGKGYSLTASEHVGKCKDAYLAGVDWAKSHLSELSKEVGK